LELKWAQKQLKYFLRDKGKDLHISTTGSRRDETAVKIYGGIVSKFCLLA
jgi:hypothetical protein